MHARMVLKRRPRNPNYTFVLAPLIDNTGIVKCILRNPFDTSRFAVDDAFALLYK